MKQKKLTPAQRKIINKGQGLPMKDFDIIFKPTCRVIDEFFIGHYQEDESMGLAVIYSPDVFQTWGREPVKAIGAYYLYFSFSSKLWIVEDMLNIPSIIDAIRCEYEIFSSLCI